MRSAPPAAAQQTGDLRRDALGAVANGEGREEEQARTAHHDAVGAIEIRVPLDDLEVWDAVDLARRVERLPLDVEVAAAVTTTLR